MCWKEKMKQQVQDEYKISTAKAVVVPCSSAKVSKSSETATELTALIIILFSKKLALEANHTQQLWSSAITTSKTKWWRWSHFKTLKQAQANFPFCLRSTYEDHASFSQVPVFKRIKTQIIFLNSHSSWKMKCYPCL